MLSEKGKRDYQLIQEAISGSQKAYNKLMELYFDSIRYEIQQRVNDEELAKDLAMESMSKALMQLDSYEPIYTFSTWLKRVAVNHTIDYLRKRKLDTTSIDDMIVSEDGEIAVQVGGEDYSPEEIMVREEKANIVRQYINRLKDVYRSLIELRYFNELSYEEIAQELAIPVGTVKARLHRAKGMLNGMIPANVYMAN